MGSIMDVRLSVDLGLLAIVLVSIWALAFVAMVCADRVLAYTPDLS